MRFHFRLALQDPGEESHDAVLGGGRREGGEAAFQSPSVL